VAEALATRCRVARLVPSYALLWDKLPSTQIEPLTPALPANPTAILLVLFGDVSNVRVGWI